MERMEHITEFDSGTIFCNGWYLANSNDIIIANTAYSYIGDSHSGGGIN